MKDRGCWWLVLTQQCATLSLSWAVAEQSNWLPTVAKLAILPHDLHGAMALNKPIKRLTDLKSSQLFCYISPS
jgi:hypothetical protein